MFVVTGLLTPSAMSNGCKGEGVLELLVSSTLVACESSNCEDKLLVLGVGVEEASPRWEIGDGVEPAFVTVASSPPLPS